MDLMTGIKATIMGIEQAAKVGIDRRTKLSLILEAEREAEQLLKKSIEMVTGKNCEVFGDLDNRFFKIDGSDFSINSIASFIENWKQERLAYAKELSDDFASNGIAIFDIDKDQILIKDKNGNLVLSLNPKTNQLGTFQITKLTAFLSQQIFKKVLKGM